MPQSDERLIDRLVQIVKAFYPEEWPMYLYATYEGPEAHEFVSKSLPSGDKWRGVGRQVEKVEVWASSIDDPGTDRYQLVAFDGDGREISRKSVQGY